MHVVAGGHLAAFVELAIGGQIRLRRHAQHRTAVNHHRGVVDPVAVAQRSADDQHRQQVGRGGNQGVYGPFDGLQQCVLQQDVVDRIARQCQFGEHRQRHAVVVAFAGRSQHRFRVGGGIADRGVQRACGNPNEPVPVGGVEAHHPIVANRLLSER